MGRFAPASTEASSGPPQEAAYRAARSRQGPVGSPAAPGGPLQVRKRVLRLAAGLIRPRRVQRNTASFGPAALNRDCFRHSLLRSRRRERRPERSWPTSRRRRSLRSGKPGRPVRETGPERTARVPFSRRVRRACRGAYGLPSGVAASPRRFGDEALPAARTVSTQTGGVPRASDFVRPSTWSERASPTVALPRPLQGGWVGDCPW